MNRVRLPPMGPVQLAPRRLSLIAFQTFNLAGPLTVSESDDWPTLSDWSPTDWLVCLKNVGSGPSTIDLLLNGEQLTTVTLETDQKIGLAPIPAGTIVLAQQDYLTASITLAGPGAGGLVAQVYGTSLQ